MNLKNIPNKTKFLITLGIFFGFSLLSNIQTVTNIDIPLVPDLTINGYKIQPLESSGQNMTSAEIRSELLSLFPYINPRDITLADREYTVPTHQSFYYFSTSLVDFIDAQFRYKSESFDCDNFAYLAKGIADMVVHNKDSETIRPFKGQLPVFKLYVKLKYEWAGVQPNGAHAINLFKTDKGWFVYEPQNGEFELAEHYPNKDYVFFITSD